MQQDFIRTQRAAGPRFSDFTEEPMFDGIPFRAPCGIVCDRNHQPKAIRNFFLQLLFPKATARPIAPSSIARPVRVDRSRVRPQLRPNRGFPGAADFGVVFAVGKNPGAPTGKTFPDHAVATHGARAA